MLLKLGVSIERLNSEIRGTLDDVDRLSKDEGIEAVISSTFEGNHLCRSKHYGDDAYDIRKYPIYSANFPQRIREVLGPDFDVVVDGNHIHIEYDPK